MKAKEAWHINFKQNSFPLTVLFVHGSSLGIHSVDAFRSIVDLYTKTKQRIVISMKLQSAMRSIILLAAFTSSTAFTVSKRGVVQRVTPSLHIASIDRKHVQPNIDDELSLVGFNSESEIAKLHSILDDGNGHINSELATSIWSWENENFNSTTDEPFPAKRLKYSTRDGIRLIDSIAQTFDQSDRYADLAQEGVVALMKSTVLWDQRHQPESKHETYEDTFEEFATRKIKHAMQKALEESSDNVNQRAKANIDLMKTRTQSKNKESEDSDSPRPLQLVQPLSEALDDANPTPIEIALSDMIRHDIDDFLVRQLSETELNIIRLRFGLEENISTQLSTEEIAASVGVSFDTVLALENQALEKLRTSFEDDYVGAYLDDDHTEEVSV